MKTLEQVQAEFKQAGISQKQWAKDNGFSYSAVRNVFAGAAVGTRGASHHILVALGVKDADTVRRTRARFGVRG